ncbi:hypothetical protein PHYSODRAFT_467477 [Phytophthora sojae]|uniref:Uncharacterized protein n=1 Tax=Phytophthora sojae (strain P6497) TaxID=1094619 RepID=G4YI19_PHYSP|nr:hypothetical protein PHYSODRAFT_467477 [Phytophthora sojae]EGZ26606.1 hypothetical protein PHYSODRAFT_467477 [Phytophthora sojae]|eukprot:XP_009513881.1 hypothetical protein PHYSODRAFT_467477 [Phytophthora sojae]
MTVTVVQPVNNGRPNIRLTRRSSSAVERATLQPPPEEKKDGGDKSLRPRFLQERSATIVHIQPSVTDPSRVPRSKASAFLLGVLAKSKAAGPGALGGLGDSKRGVLEPLRSGVTNTVHYVPPQGVERGIPLRMAGRRNSRLFNRQLSIASAAADAGLPDGARKRRVSASQEHMTAVLRALQASKQQAPQQLDILHSILRFINTNDRDEDGKRPVLKEMVDVGFIPELSSILREFRFNTDVQVCAMSILATIADESPVYAYMMSEKNATVHGTHERLVVLASNLAHTIEDSKHSVNIPAYQADKAARLRRQSATYADMIVAAIGASKPKKSVASPSPSRCSTARRSCHSGILDTQEMRSRTTPSSAPLPEKSGSERELSRSVGKQRQSFALTVGPPKLSANYRLLFAQKLKKSEVQPLQKVENEKIQSVDRSDHQERRDRPASSPSRKSLPLDLTSRSLATAIYSGGSIFVEPSPLSKRLPRQGSFSAGGVRRKLCAPKRVQRANTEKLPPTQPLSMRSTETPENSVPLDVEPVGPEASLIADNPTTTARSVKDAELSDEDEDEGEEVPAEEEVEKGKKENDEEEDDEESYEDDFDTTGDDENEDKAMPSRNDNDTIASDGELFNMLHDISAQDLATTIQRHIRGTLAQQAYPRPASCDAKTQASEKKTPRATSNGKTAKRDSRIEEAKRKQIPLSARAHRQLQSQGSTRRDKYSRNESIPRTASRMRPATAMSSPLITPIKTKVPSARNSVRHPSLATDSQRLSPSRSLQSVGHSSLKLFSSNSLHDIGAGSTEVAKEPPDPEALKQIQTLYAEGLQHQKENHLGLAIECYEKALAIPGGQTFASIHVNIGSALMAKSKFSEALEFFQQAKRFQPNNVKAIYNYSLALLHLDRPQEAQRLVSLGGYGGGCP